MSILQTRATHFSVDGIEFGGQATAATIKSSANGWRPLDSLVAEFDYTIDITAGQDLGPDSLWSVVYTQAGQLVPIVLKPYGNADAPSEDKPWVSTTAIVMEPDGDFIGGAQEESTTTRRTFEVSWSCDRPVLITTAP